MSSPKRRVFISLLFILKLFSKPFIIRSLKKKVFIKKKNDFAYYFVHWHGEVLPIRAATFIRVIGIKKWKGETSNWQKQAVITLIEKKGKDRSLAENRRPISLVNVDTKIIESKKCPTWYNPLKSDWVCKRSFYRRTNTICLRYYGFHCNGN